MSTFNGKLADPEVRIARARRAAQASHTGAGTVRRFLNHLDELTPEQIETVRRALPPAWDEDARS